MIKVAYKVMVAVNRFYGIEDLDHANTFYSGILALIAVGALGLAWG